jgi:ribosome recycling factor
MLDDVVKELRASSDKALDALRRDLAKVRTGRAHPSMLDGIRVDYYGTTTPLAQMATINVPEPRLMTVKPWDKGQVKAVDKAIREGDLGLNPQVDGDLIRIPIPALTEERRKEFVKVLRRNGEECKVAIRKHRRDAMELIEQLKKDGDVSEDDADRASKKVEDTTAELVKQVDTTVAAKEKDVMEV